MEDTKMTKMTSNLCGDNGVLSAVATLLSKQQNITKDKMLTPNSLSVMPSGQSKGDMESNVVLGSCNEVTHKSITSDSFAQSLEQVHALATANLLASTQRDIVQQLANAMTPSLCMSAGDTKKRQNSKPQQNKKRDFKSVQDDDDDKPAIVNDEDCTASEPKALVCSFDGCNRKFAWQTHLKYHEMTHTNNRQFECPDENCRKAFFTAQSLKVHLRTHTGEKPFKCSYENCGKTFTTAGNLKNHVRIHTGNQPFSCDFDGCNRRFTEYSSLYKHKLTHSGDKPFECKICNKKFSQSGSRRQHLRRHHLDEEIRNSSKSRAYHKNDVVKSMEQEEQSVSMSDIIQSDQDSSKVSCPSLSHSTQVMVLSNAYSHPTSESIMFPSGLNEHIMTVTSAVPHLTSSGLSFSHGLLNPEGLHETNQEVKSDELVVLSHAPIYRHDDQTRDIVYATDMLDHEGVTNEDYHISGHVDSPEDIVTAGSFHHQEESRVQTDVSLHHSVEPIQSDSMFHPRYQSPKKFISYEEPHHPSVTFTDKKGGMSSAFITTEGDVLHEDFIGASEVTISTSSNLLVPDDDVGTSSFSPVKENVTSLIDWDEHIHKQ